MNHLAAWVVMGILGATTPALAQSTATPDQPAPTVAPASSATDSQLLRDILEEMRGIHNDVRLSQTTQILLTEMEVQRSVVDKAMEKRDAARNRVTSLQMNEKNMAMQIEQMQQNADSTIDPVRQKQMAQQVQIFKSEIANSKSQEVDAGNTLADADSALRKEQDVLDGIQAQLNDVVRKLQPAH